MGLIWSALTPSGVLPLGMKTTFQCCTAEGKVCSVSNRLSIWVILSQPSSGSVKRCWAEIPSGPVALLAMLAAMLRTCHLFSLGSVWAWVSSGRSSLYIRQKCWGSASASVSHPKIAFQTLWITLRHATLPATPPFSKNWGGQLCLIHFVALDRLDISFVQASCFVLVFRLRTSSSLPKNSISTSVHCLFKTRWRLQGSRLLAMLFTRPLETGAPLRERKAASRALLMPRRNSLSQKSGFNLSWPFCFVFFP